MKLQIEITYTLLYIPSCLSTLGDPMNAFTEKLLNELFAKYKDQSTLASGTNLELEIRFRDITRDAFETLYTEIYASSSGVKPEFAQGKLECSVNIISENVYEKSTSGHADETQYIRKITFKGSTPIADTYHQKIRIARPVTVADYIKYSVGLSKESDSKKFSTSQNAHVRFKVRVSFDYIGAPPRPAKWRFDLTAIKRGSLAELGASLKTIKKDLFTDALAPDNFLRELNFDVIDEYEVEIENIDPVHTVTIDDLAIVKKAFSMINPQYLAEIAYQEEIYHCAQYIVTHNYEQFKQPTHRLKQLGNQVITLSKNTYYADVFPPDGYYATIKTDGQRAIISVNGTRCRVLKSDSMIEYIVGGTFVPGEITIVDAEMLVLGAAKDTKDTTHKVHTTFYIFDVMVFRDENVGKSGFTTRIGHLEDAAELINDMVRASGSDASAEPKNYVRLSKDNLEAGFREVWEEESDIPRDGIILTEPDESYHTTKNYKWKPYSHNTIDFLAVKCPQKLLGIKPYLPISGKDLYLLFVGINHNMREKLGLGFIPQYHQMFPKQDNSSRGEGPSNNYYPIQFSPSANPLAYLYYHDKTSDINKQIVELSRDENNTQWIFHGVRTDRKLERNYFGNDFRVAELTYSNYIDPFNFEELWKPAASYFTKTATDIYTASNKFKRFVISMLLKDNLSGAKWVIDEAAGRGGDLHRYQEIGVENALFIDVDPTAITELIRRKFSFFQTKKRHIRNWFNEAKKGGSAGGNASGNEEALSGQKTKVITQYDRVHDVEYDKLIIKDVKSLTVHTLVADLKTPHKDLVASTFQFGINPAMIDGIVCNFALHYMCDTIEHIRNLLMFNARMLKVGGVFIFTVMDGKSVFDLLKPLSTGQQWEAREDGVLKYAFKKNYSGEKLSPSGQMISVLLPFSDEMYEEPLCNVDTVIAEATKLGFEVELNSPMTAFMDKFSRADRSLFDKLTENDRKYIALHRYCSLRLIKSPK